MEKNVQIQIIRARDGVYDVYSLGENGPPTWLMSFGSADNVFTFLSEMSDPILKFIDNSIYRHL